MKTVGKLGLLLVITVAIIAASLNWTRNSAVEEADEVHPHLSLLGTNSVGKLSSVGKLVRGDYWQQLSGAIVDSSSSSKATLSASPALLENGGRVTVSWDSVPDPSKRRRSDLIGFYCPPSARSQQFLDYWQVNQSLTYLEGRGSAEFTLYNLRMDCEFRYFTTDTGTELLAVSNVVSFVNGKRAPLHGHLALTGDPTEMRVQWTSGDKSTPTVHYGSSEANLQHTATGVWRTYSHSDMCGPPANLSRYFVHPGYLHNVLLTGLEPGSRYYYRYGSEGVYSEVRSFRTGLGAGDHTPYQFIIFGDMNITPPPGAATTAELVLREVENGASFVIIDGDLSYAVGLAYRWDMWMTLIEPFTSLAPCMVAIGNHEQNHRSGGAKDPSHAPGNGFHPVWGNYGDDSGGECGLPAYRRFHMPETGHGLWWYSYDYGLVHFTVFSTEHNFTAGSPQYEWLEKDLEAVNRSVTPWLIVIGHRPMYRPMYRNGRYKSDLAVCMHIRESLEDRFIHHRVDLAFWGHYHSYMRTCAIYKKKCTAEGIVHIMVGSGGFWSEAGGVYDVPWVKHYETTYGYGRVSVANSSALLWEFVRNTDNTVSDTVWIQK